MLRDHQSTDLYMKSMRSTLFGIALLGLTPGCGIGSEQADVEPGQWQTAEPLWIGEVEGDGPEVFGSIASMAVDQEGRILVFDGRAYELRVFSPDGSFVSRVGRRGGGPGEFQHVIGMSVAPDGSLWLIDGANARYTVLRDDDVETYTRGAGVYTVPWTGGHADGHLYDVVMVPGGPSREALVRVDEAGAVVDTFAVPVNEIETPRVGSIRLPLPYAPSQIRTFDHSGALWVAMTHEYTLYQIGREGDTLRIIGREEEARPLSPTESDSVSQHIRALREQFRLEVRDGLVPRAAPLLRRITVADDGSIWVTRADPPPGLPSGSQFDVFDGDGNLIGELSVDFSLSLRLVQDGHMYGVARDELGVERVFRARVERGR
jgi:hypothetical protein